MKIGSNQNPVTYSSTESNVASEKADAQKAAASKKPVDTMTNARPDGFAADGKITMGERFQTKSSAVKVIQDGKLTDAE